jgi:hypothetical protein
MNILKTLLAAAIVGISLNVAAGPEYMADMNKVDTALKTRTYSPTTTDEARRLRGDAERMMKENREAEAMKVLERVKTLLEIK